MPPPENCRPGHARGVCPHLPPPPAATEPNSLCLREGTSFFSVLPALITFCHSLKPTGIVITTEHSWMEKCTKFCQSILSKIIKIVATSWRILRLICTKFDFGCGSAPDPAGRAHSAPPNHLAGFKGA